MRKIINDAKQCGCEAVVIDIDGTGYHGKFAETIGYGFLSQEIRRVHPRNTFIGIGGLLKIKTNSFLNHDHEKDARNLEILFKCLGKTGIADSETAYGFARRHMREKELPGFGDFVQDCKTIGPVFISTAGPDIGANLVRENYGLNGQVSNPVIYRYQSKEVSGKPVVYLRDGKLEGALELGNENSIISGCNLAIKNSEEKKKHTISLLENFGLGLDCAVSFCNDYLDRGIINASRLAVASPLAEEETRKEAHVSLKSYKG